MFLNDGHQGFQALLLGLMPQWHAGKLWKFMQFWQVGAQPREKYPAILGPVDSLQRMLSLGSLTLRFSSRLR